MQIFNLTPLSNDELDKLVLGIKKGFISTFGNHARKAFKQTNKMSFHNVQLAIYNCKNIGSQCLNNNSEDDLVL